jgi:N6-adenosine-specific RNA methylase IME4
MDRSAANHYPVMSIADIKTMSVPAAPDAVLFLWAMVPMLPQAFEVIAAWGVAYKNSLYWLKPSVGTGYWTRNRVEQLLIGTCGAIPAPLPGGQPAQIEGPRGRHSEKPEDFARMIERLYPNLPRIELFARRSRPGWESSATKWGSGASPAARSIIAAFPFCRRFGPGAAATPAERGRRAPEEVLLRPAARPRVARRSARRRP